MHTLQKAQKNEDLLVHGILAIGFAFGQDCQACIDEIGIFCASWQSHARRDTHARRKRACLSTFKHGRVQGRYPDTDTEKELTDDGHSTSASVAPFSWACGTMNAMRHAALQQFSQRHRGAATAAEKHVVPGLFGELMSPFPGGISGDRRAQANRDCSRLFSGN